MRRCPPQPVTKRSRQPRAARIEMCLPARLRAPGGWQDAMIYNIGPGGMMLRCSFPPVAGTQVLVRCGSTSVRGNVRWSQHGKCGIQADTPLDPAKMVEGREVRSREGATSLLRLIRLVARKLPKPSNDRS